MPGIILKSYSDKYTSLQIGGYIFSALQKQAQNNEPLSLVNAVQLLIQTAQGPRSLQKSFIIYLYSRGRLKETILSSLPEPVKKTVMNTLDIYIEKGRKATK
ncbi:MAG: hypothetical protein KF862_17735 [Chitinophagaceae bacterium]|nr:hypothetical protein [Chitinophagaceae bacterium]